MRNDLEEIRRIIKNQEKENKCHKNTFMLGIGMLALVAAGVAVWYFFLKDKNKDDDDWDDDDWDDDDDDLEDLDDDIEDTINSSTDVDE